MSCCSERKLSGLKGFSQPNTTLSAEGFSAIQVDLQYLLVLYRVIAIPACAVLILIIMAAPQPLLVHDLLAQIRAFISAISPPAVLLLNICVEGADEQTTFRVSVQRDGSLVSLSECEQPSSSSSSSPIALSNRSGRRVTSSSSSACSSSSTSLGSAANAPAMQQRHRTTLRQKRPPLR